VVAIPADMGETQLDIDSAMWTGNLQRLEVPVVLEDKIDGAAGRGQESRFFPVLHVLKEVPSFTEPHRMSD